MADGIKVLRIDVSVAFKHFPVFVTGCQGYLWNLIFRFKWPTGRFMPEIMEVQIVDP